MSVESRIRALKRARLRRCRRRSNQIQKAEEAVDRGTATMDQYRLHGQTLVAAKRDDAAQHTVVFVTMARLGKSDFWPAALGYPPDVALPRSVQAEIMRLQADATEPPRPKVRQRLVSAAVLPADRLEAACKLLALGDLHGLVLRRRVWRIVGREWVLSDAALASGAKTFLSPDRADFLMGLGDRVTRGIESGAIAVGPDGDVSYTELDRAVVAYGWKADYGRATWSNLVTSGQPGESEVCKDLQFGVHRIDCTATLAL